MAVIAVIFSDHFPPGHDGDCCTEQWDVLASDGSVFALGARNWIQFTLSLKKRERDNKLYFGGDGD